MTRTISLLLLIAALVSACGGDPSLSDELREGAAADTALGYTEAHAAPGDRAGTMMIEEVPLGIHYEEVCRRVAGLGEMKPELEGSAEELTEARTTMQVLGYDADVEFNFRRDTLYSYYFHVHAASCADADVLYNEVVELYCEAFGQPQEESEDEGGYTWRSSSWTLTADVEASQSAVTIGRQAEMCRVGWGFD